MGMDEMMDDRSAGEQHEGRKGARLGGTDGGRGM